SPGTAPYSIGTVENRRLDGPGRIFIFVHCCSPSVHLGSCKAHQAAGHKQPKRMVVVLDHPVNCVAGQSVLAGQRGNAAVPHPAESALGGGPDRAVGIVSKTVNRALAKPVGGCVRCADLTIPEVNYATLIKSKP